VKHNNAFFGFKVTKKPTLPTKSTKELANQNNG